MATHPDIQREQAHLDRAYDRLEAMRSMAAARRDEVLGMGRGGTHQAREERDVIVRTSMARLEQLDLGDLALCFGRIDQVSGERFYIGRLAVSDVDQEPLVVDWRAPVAEPFYRATGRHPMGLSRRRHFLTQGRRLTGIEDELLDLDAGDIDESSLVGEGALLASLDRSRTGAMRDIVATIQAEQDEIIRAPLPDTLVVQGGPGTGKTAVALHRAAYLLYTHRFPLELQGVLVIGPNPLFLRYIGNVLPSLGETGVTLSTVSGLYHGARATGTDAPESARVKGDRRMAEVVAKAVRDRQRPLPRDVVVPYGAYQLRMRVADSAEIVGAARRRPGTHNGRRVFVEAQVHRHLFREYEAATGRANRAGLGGRAAAESEEEFESFAEAVRDLPEVREILHRIWPRLSPQELLHDLLGARSLIDLAARRWLPDHDRRALYRKRSAGPDEVAWTEADIALLDEAAVHLGSRRRTRSGRPVDDAVGVVAHGHVVVDEAQDLTPMQLRMVGRRCISGSITLVGDIGQATGAWPPRTWHDVLEHLPARRDPRIVELTVNYRTPAEIMDVAGRVLAEAAPELSPPTSVRNAGAGPEVRTLPAGADLLAAARLEADRLRSLTGGSVAVVVPPGLEGAHGAGEVDLDDPVSVVPAPAVKGLEFDGVVVVEPAALVERSPQGLRALYVALTRATKRLVVVHSRPLPAALGLAEAPVVG